MPACIKCQVWKGFTSKIPKKRPAACLPKHVPLEKAIVLLLSAD